MKLNIQGVTPGLFYTSPAANRKAPARISIQPGHGSEIIFNLNNFRSRVYPLQITVDVETRRPFYLPGGCKILKHY